MGNHVQVRILFGAFEMLAIVMVAGFFCCYPISVFVPSFEACDRFSREEDSTTVKHSWESLWRLYRSVKNGYRVGNR